MEISSESAGYQLFTNEAIFVLLEMYGTLDNINSQIISNAITEVWDELGPSDREEFTNAANARIPPPYHMSDEMHEMIHLAIASSQILLILPTPLGSGGNGGAQNTIDTVDEPSSPCSVTAIL